MTRERSIILRDRDVRAVLAGTKTQHRVPVNMRHVDFIGGSGDDRNDPDMWGFADECGCWHVLSQSAPPWYGDGVTGESYAIVPPYQIGDTLRVLECFALIWPGEDAPESDRDCIVEYRADGDADRLPGRWPPEGRGDPCCPRWRSSSSMPKWASRIRLRVTDVRVERDGDAWAWAVTWEIADA